MNSTQGSDQLQVSVANLNTLQALNNKRKSTFQIFSEDKSSISHQQLPMPELSTIGRNNISQIPSFTALPSRNVSPINKATMFNSHRPSQSNSFENYINSQNRFKMSEQVIFPQKQETIIPKQQDHLSQNNNMNDIDRDSNSNYDDASKTKFDSFNLNSRKSSLITRTARMNPLESNIQLSNFSKEEERQNKKVFYSLKKAIVNDTHNKLQQLTQEKRTIITEDIKQNFIPKLYQMEQPTHEKNKEPHINVSGGRNFRKVSSENEKSSSQKKYLEKIERKGIQNSLKERKVSPFSSPNMLQSGQPKQSDSAFNLNNNTSMQSTLNLTKNQSINKGDKKTQALQNNFKKMAFIYQSDQHAIDNGIDQKLLMVIKIIDSRAKIMKDLKNFNSENTIQKLTEILKFSIEYDDIELMGDIISAIGEVYLMFGDTKSAINTFNSLRQLADITWNFKMKVDCLLNLSQITKKLKYYSLSLRFIKKALQYVWEINDVDKEIHIYEEIGLIYFHQCDMQNASSFHQRAMSGGVEYQESNQRRQASKNLHYYLSQLDPKTDIIDRQIIIKIPSLPFSFVSLSNMDINFLNNQLYKDDGETLPPHVKNAFMNKYKMQLALDIEGFNSSYSEQYQLDNIFSSQEFSIEISTPRNDSQLNRFAINEEESVTGGIRKSDQDQSERNSKLNSKVHSNKLESVVGNKLSSQHFKKFIPPQNIVKKDSSHSTYYLSEDMKKKTLEEKIKERVVELQLWEKRGMLGKLMHNPQNQKNGNRSNQPIQINHLGVNRNIDNFDSSQNIQVSRSNVFFNKIITSQYQKTTNINIS